ncbi:MAG: hypothetical protein RLZ12_231 [Bacillota bacterium]
MNDCSINCYGLKNFVGGLKGDLDNLEAALRAYSSSVVLLDLMEAHKAPVQQVDVNIWHGAPHLMPPPDLLAACACYNIAYWFWEQPVLPAKYYALCNVVQEFWVASSFIKESIEQVTKTPVYYLPSWVAKEQRLPMVGRDYFELAPDKFIFLMMYDATSCRLRKNPDAVIKAFKLAFPPADERVQLLIKLKKSGLGSQEARDLEKVVAGSENIKIIYENFSDQEVDAFLALVDVVVSLHRAEGFGRVLVEAQQRGKPVICTNWSGNTDFTTKENACLVDYTLQELQQPWGPYEAGALWAEPDIRQAANYMERLVNDPAFYCAKATRGRADIMTKFSKERVFSAITKRLQEVKQIAETRTPR